MIYRRRKVKRNSVKQWQGQDPLEVLSAIVQKKDISRVFAMECFDMTLMLRFMASRLWEAVNWGISPSVLLEPLTRIVLG